MPNRGIPYSGACAQNATPRRFYQRNPSPQDVDRARLIRDLFPRESAAPPFAEFIAGAKPPSSLRAAKNSPPYPP